MEQIKEAFSKVKQDMDSLKKEVSLLNKEMIETRESLFKICDILAKISHKIEEDKKGDDNSETFTNQDKTQLQGGEIPARPEENSTYSLTLPTDIYLSSTSNPPQNPYKAQNKEVSTGNEGVPTDRQTNQQTDQHTDKSSYNTKINQHDNSINNAAQILDSLDNLKKEIRLKFKRLTDQEFSVFSVIYLSSEETGYTDYKNLSEKLNLTESSIRDYIGRLIKKGIPLEKTKINNKTIHISISQNLKKIATLPTILQLRAI
jgi:hypothetical protein